MVQKEKGLMPGQSPPQRDHCRETNKSMIDSHTRPLIVPRLDLSKIHRQIDVPSESQKHHNITEIQRYREILKENNCNAIIPPNNKTWTSAANGKKVEKEQKLKDSQDEFAAMMAEYNQSWREVLADQEQI